MAVTVNALVGTGALKSTTSTTVTLGWTPAVGDLLVMGLAVHAGLTTFTITQTGVTWSLLATKANSTSVTVQVYIGIVNSTPSTSISVSTGAAVDAAVEVAGLTGADVKSVTAVRTILTAGATGASTTLAPGSATPAYDSSCILQFGGWLTLSTVGSPSTGTSLGSVSAADTSSKNVNVAGAYSIQSGVPVAFAPTWTLSASSTWAGLGVSVKPDTTIHSYGSLGSHNQATAATTNVLSVGTAVPAGGTVFVIAMANSPTVNGAGSCVDSRGNTYTAQAHQSDAANWGGYLFAAVNLSVGLVAGDTITVTFPSSVAFSTIAAVGFDGSQVDVVNSNSAGTAAAWSGPSVTTTDAADVVISGGVTGGGTPIAVTTTPWSAQFILVESGTDAMATGLRWPGATGVYTVAGTQAAGALGSMGYVLALKSGSGPPTPILVSDSGAGAEIVASPMTANAFTIHDGGSSVAPVYDLPTQLAAALPWASGGAVREIAASGAVAVTDPLAESGHGTDALAGSVAAALADTGTGADALAVVVSVPITDSGTATAETLAAVATVPLAQSGTGSETLADTASVPLADAGTASGETVAVAVPISVTDAGTATAEVQTISANAPLAETGTASAETLAAAVTLALADASGATADAATVAATVPVADAGTGSETLTVAATNLVTVADSGTASAETAAVAATVALADAGTASAEAAAVAASAPLADAGTATAEAQTVTAAVPLADAGTSAEALFVSFAAVLADSGTGAEALALAVTVPLAQAGGGAEALAGTVAAPLADAGSGTDAVAIAQPTAVIDAGTGTETLLVVDAPVLADAGTGAETLAASAAGALPDGGSGVDVLSVVVVLTLVTTGAGVDVLGTTYAVRIADVGAGVDGIVVVLPTISAVVSPSGTGTLTPVTPDNVTERGTLVAPVGSGHLSDPP